MNDFGFFIMAGFILMLFPIMVISFFMKGFFFKYFRIKASRGKLKLVKLIKVNNQYNYCIGKINDNFLKFKDVEKNPFSKKKDERSIPIPEGYIFIRELGIDSCEVDDASNNLIIKGLPRNTFDAKKYDGMIERALMLPKSTDELYKLIQYTLIVCIVGLLILLGVAFISFKNYQILKILLINSNTIIEQTTKVVVNTGGNIL
jgi:hypothetical protein